MLNQLLCVETSLLPDRIGMSLKVICSVSDRALAETTTTGISHVRASALSSESVSNHPSSAWSGPTPPDQAAVAVPNPDRPAHCWIRRHDTVCSFAAGDGSATVIGVVVNHHNRGNLLVKLFQCRSHTSTGRRSRSAAGYPGSRNSDPPVRASPR